MKKAIIVSFGLMVLTAFFPAVVKADTDGAFPVELFGLDYSSEVSTAEDPWCEGICASHYGMARGSKYYGSLGNRLYPDTDYFVALPAQEDSLDCLDGRMMHLIDDDRAAFRVLEIKPHGKDGPILEATVEDVGPWYCGDDPYWANGTRPESEDGRDAKGRTTNCAGIDLSYKLAMDLGIRGIGDVDWRFKKANGKYVVVEKNIQRR